MNKNEGMNYAPKGKLKPVVTPGEFIFSVIGLDHGHIKGMTNGLIEAGATLKYVYDPDQEKVKDFLLEHPDITVAESKAQVLEDDDTQLIASACITYQRAPLGIEVMNAGKDYFVDKAPFTTLQQIEDVKKVIQKTKKKYMVYYSELIHVEGAIYAQQLVKDGAIGEVIQVLGLGPHRLGEGRPDWFFEKNKYGGILCDIGSHNIYQFLEYANIDNATVAHSKIGNYNNPEHPELDDFGDATLVGENGSSCYFQVDWFTPKGLSTWGDGRVKILGTDGYIEIRKYTDVGVKREGDNVILVNHDGEFFNRVYKKVGYPFFGELILDCINRTENAQTQHRAIKAGELSIIAQNQATVIKK